MKAVVINLPKFPPQMVENNFTTTKFWHLIILKTESPNCKVSVILLYKEYLISQQRKTNQFLRIIPQASIPACPIGKLQGEKAAPKECREERSGTSPEGRAGGLVQSLERSHSPEMWKYWKSSQARSTGQRFLNTSDFSGQTPLRI